MSSDLSFEAVSRSHGFQQPSLMLANSTNCRQSLSRSGCSDPSWAGSGISSLVGAGGGSSDRQKHFFWAGVGGAAFSGITLGCACVGPIRGPCSLCKVRAQPSLAMRNTGFEGLKKPNHLGA